MLAAGSLAAADPDSAFESTGPFALLGGAGVAAVVVCAGLVAVLDITGDRVLVSLPGEVTPVLAGDASFFFFFRRLPRDGIDAM